MKKNINKILGPALIVVLAFLLFAPFSTWFGKKSIVENKNNKWVLVSKNIKNVSCLAVDPSNSKTLYAGTYEAGIYRSDDMGVTWKEINTDIENKNIISLAINPKFPSILYVGTKKTDSYPATIYRTADNGEHWVRVKVKQGIEMVANDIIFDNQQLPTIYICGTGLWYSTDNGSSWKEKTPYACNSLVVDAKNNKIIYYNIYGENGGIYKLSDGIGSKPSKIPMDFQNLDKNTIIKLALDSSNPDNLYATAINNGVGLYHSYDGGKNWEETSTNIIEEDTRTYSNIFCLIINPKNGTNAYACDPTNVYKILDSGNNWEIINYNLPKVSINCLAFDSLNPSKIYIAMGTSKEKGEIYYLDLAGR